MVSVPDYESGRLGTYHYMSSRRAADSAVHLSSQMVDEVVYLGKHGKVNFGNSVG